MGQKLGLGKKKTARVQLQIIFWMKVLVKGLQNLSQKYTLRSQKGLESCPKLFGKLELLTLKNSK